MRAFILIIYSIFAFGISPAMGEEVKMKGLMVCGDKEDPNLKEIANKIEWAFEQDVSILLISCEDFRFNKTTTHTADFVVGVIKKAPFQTEIILLDAKGHQIFERELGSQINIEKIKDTIRDLRRVINGEQNILKKLSSVNQQKHRRDIQNIKAAPVMDAASMKYDQKVWRLSLEGGLEWMRFSKLIRDKNKEIFMTDSSLPALGLRLRYEPSVYFHLAASTRSTWQKYEIFEEFASELIGAFELVSWSIVFENLFRIPLSKKIFLLAEIDYSFSFVLPSTDDVISQVRGFLPNYRRHVLGLGVGIEGRWFADALQIYGIMSYRPLINMQFAANLSPWNHITQGYQATFGILGHVTSAIFVDATVVGFQTTMRPLYAEHILFADNGFSVSLGVGVAW